MWLKFCSQEKEEPFPALCHFTNTAPKTIQARDKATKKPAKDVTPLKHTEPSGFPPTSVHQVICFFFFLQILSE